ncbi:unnamed protein product [Symbiodinium natans]|uniref:Uncharacterized protein n=1 Tax=Symbiodinium natans TaxID=878477 RepID=A0A812V1Z2_9DINO|nr:unnamed protein product [Symbiodinium natans]
MPQNGWKVLSLATLAICCSRKVRDRIDSDWFVDEEDSELSEKQADAEQDDTWLQAEDVEEVGDFSDATISVHFEEDQSMQSIVIEDFSGTLLRAWGASASVRCFGCGRASFAWNHPHHGQTGASLWPTTR